MKIPIFPGKYHQNGGFSMAMLVSITTRDIFRRCFIPLADGKPSANRETKSGGPFSYGETSRFNPHMLSVIWDLLYKVGRS